MEENNEKQPCYRILNIESAKYKTLLTDKFRNRKPYEPKNPKHVTAFIPGNIPKVFVKEGKKVKEGQKLLILEAMKMKNMIFADRDETIKKIHVKEGDQVAKEQLLIEFE